MIVLVVDSLEIETGMTDGAVEEVAVVAVITVVLEAEIGSVYNRVGYYYL